MRIALAQLNPVVGDVAGNLRLILDAISLARSERAQVLVTSELALIGYPPRDLLLRQGVVEACEQSVEAIAQAAGEMCVIVGHPRRCEHGTRRLRNSVSLCQNGSVRACYDKRLLPGYDVFDEDRYFEPGDRPLVLEIAGMRCGIVVCEDLWRANDVTADLRYPIEPVAEVAREGAQVIISLNASPFVLGKWRRHLNQLSDIASATRTIVIAVNQVGANDDLIFDGRSAVIAPDGSIAQVSQGFASETRVIDLGLIQTKAAASRRSDGAADALVSHWVDPSRELFNALALGIRDYVHKTGHRELLIGLSGGIDSALAAALAAAAIGSSHVHGVMMPSIHSSQGSIDDAKELSKRLQLGSLHDVSIKQLHDTMRSSIRSAMGRLPAGLTDENIQARLRGLMLMTISNDVGALVIATSNKSEMAVGYSTLYGDMCGALAPLADLTKTRIYQLSRWMNEHHIECGFSQPPIPQNSIDKPPSAELRPNQTDQDTLPPYDLLDQIIERRIELEQCEATIIAETGFDAALVRRTLSMIDRAQYKRDQAPVVLKVMGRAFGPGRPMPIVMRERLSLNEPIGDNLSIARLAIARASTNGEDVNAASDAPRISNAH